MKSEIPLEIKDWAFWLSSGVLGTEKFPLCPWAKKSILEGSVDFWIDEDPMDLVPLPEGIKVRLVHFPFKSKSDLEDIRSSCNSIGGEFIF